MKTSELLLPIVTDDLEVIEHKEKTYKGSWRKRGGAGAFMMLARKWDRIENMAEAAGYDIFTLLREDESGADGTMLAEVRDLRRYLILVESVLLQQPSEDSPAKKCLSYNCT